MPSYTDVYMCGCVDECDTDKQTVVTTHCDKHKPTKLSKRPIYRRVELYGLVHWVNVDNPMDIKKEEDMLYV